MDKTEILYYNKKSQAGEDKVHWNACHTAQEAFDLALLTFWWKY